MTNGLRINSLASAMMLILLLGACYPHAETVGDVASSNTALISVRTMTVGGTIRSAPFPCADVNNNRCAESGTVMSGNARAVLLEPADSGFDHPIIMLHGLGLTGDMYLSTVDNKVGWGMHTARAGITTYLVTLPTVVASGLDTAPFNAAKAGAMPVAEQNNLATWVPEVLWSLFGYGPVYPELYPGVQFAIEDLPGLLAGISPYIEPLSGPGLSDNQAVDRAALLTILKQTGPAIVLTHSLSGPVGFQVATEHPDLVRAIVTIEPAQGCPAAFADTNIPVLAMFGDFLETRERTQRASRTCAELEEEHQAKGVDSRGLVLAEHGMPGHTHMLPVDRNSHLAAQFMIDWLIELHSSNDSD